MRRTRVRRGASPRRSRSIRTRRHARVRHQSARRGRYDRRAPAPRWSFGKSLMAAMVAAAVVLAAASYLMVHHGIRALLVAVDGPAGETGAVAAQFVYTARTANDATVSLPDVVKDDLRRLGLAHHSITLTRVGFDGNVSTSSIDMTPYTGSSSTGPVLKVTGRAVPVIDAKISGIEKTVNYVATTTGGGRALYSGLTRIDFTAAPVTIISSGLDLADPDDFRSLKWSVPPAAVTAQVKKAGAMPALHGPVTFAVVPTAGSQPQLTQAQKNYRKAVWRSLLTTAGATSVTFIDASTTTVSSKAPSAPTVPVPGLPATPIPQISQAKNRATCTVPATFFIFNTAKLIDAAKTEQDLTPCVSAALAAHASFALDGWTSYEGRLNASGKPAVHNPWNRQLSTARVQAIANLLVGGLGVPRSAITRLTGHGNVNQPDPDPRSPANRVVVITYTVQ